MQHHAPSLTGNASAADQMALRRHNLGLVLRNIRDLGPHSRAKIATSTGLNKATVSSLVTELADRGLVRDGSLERGNVGRPGHTVELDGATVCGIGAEVNVNHVEVLALDRDLVLLARDVTAPPLYLELPWLGTYRWRVAARDARGVESRPSEPGLICSVDR